MTGVCRERMSGRCSAILLTVQPKITISTERHWRVQQVAAGRRHAVLWMYKNCCWLSITVIWMLVASFALRGVWGRFHTELESKTWNLLLVLRFNMMYSQLLLVLCAACEQSDVTWRYINIRTLLLMFCGHCQLDMSNFQPFTGQTLHLVSQQLDDPTCWPEEVCSYHQENTQQFSSTFMVFTMNLSLYT